MFNVVYKKKQTFYKELQLGNSIETDLNMDGGRDRVCGVPIGGISHVMLLSQ